jgi:branched-chain amino acid transport system ATP-binding protein
LGLAIALPLYPKVLCLDEPFTGLNLVEAREIVGVLHQVQAARNLAIILVEHRVPILMELCDRLVVLNFGEIIATGRPEDIRRDPEVEKIYFGTGAH